MKCVCVKDVVMRSDGKREFTRGKIYCGKDRYLTNDSGNEGHYVISGDRSFFDEHFIELVEEKITPTNICYTAAQEALAEFYKTASDTASLFSFQRFVAVRLHFSKAENDA
jgi:hypothetical protein